MPRPSPPTLGAHPRRKSGRRYRAIAVVVLAVAAIGAGAVLLRDGSNGASSDAAADGAVIDAAGPAVADGIVGYSFTWTTPGRPPLDVTVDHATGDFSISGAGGLEFRAVEGVGYGRATSSDDYRIISGDPRRAIAEFGLDGVRTIGGALPESVRAHIVTDDVVIDQTGQVETLLIDDARFRAEDHAARTSWLAEWGLLRDFSAPAEPYLVGGEPVPDRAAPGEVVVRLWSDANELDGRVQRMELDVPVLGGTVVYELTEVLEVAPTITAPEL